MPDIQECVELQEGTVLPGGCLPTYKRPSSGQESTKQPGGRRLIVRTQSGQDAPNSEEGTEQRGRCQFPVKHQGVRRQPGSERDADQS